MDKLDKILKDSFEGFTPDAPAGLWNGIEQGIDSGAATSGWAGKSLTSFKNLGWFAKTLLIGALPIAGALYLVFQHPEPAVQPVVQSIQKPGLEQLEPNAEDAKQTAPQVTATGITKEKLQASSKGKTTEEFVRLQQPVTPEEAKHFSDVLTNQPQAQATEHKNETKPEPSQVAANAQGTETEVESANEHVESKVAEPQTVNTFSGEEHVKIPNIFTPNGDGANDRYEVKIDYERTFAIRIYDLKGKMVFESTDKSLCWDGNHYRSGQQCEAGRYYAEIDYQLNGQNEPVRKKVFINLTR